MAGTTALLRLKLSLHLQQRQHASALRRGLSIFRTVAPSFMEAVAEFGLLGSSFDFAC